MKAFHRWFHAGRALAPALRMAAALAAFGILAGTPAAHAQGPATESAAFADAGGNDVEFELADAPAGCDGCPMGICDGSGRGRGGPGMGGMRHGGRGMHGRMGMGRGMGGRGAFRAEMMEKLDLTAAQKEKMADLRETQQRKMIGIRSGLAEAQLDLRKLMRADEPSQAQIESTIDRMSRLRGDAQKSRIATHLAMRGLLTDAQKKTLDEMKTERRGMGGGPGDGSGKGGGRRGV